MSDEIYAIWVEITIGKVSYLICIVCRPPSAQTGYYKKILGTMLMSYMFSERAKTDDVKNVFSD